MILMASSHIYMFCFSKVAHVLHMYIFYWSYAKIRWISIFWVVSEVFGTAKTVFTGHVRPIYIRELSTPSNPNLAKPLSSLSCGDQGSPKVIWELLHWAPSISRGFDSPSPQDLQTLSGSLSILRYSQGSPSISSIYCWFLSMLDLLTLEHL
jgi:hypothetical protein